jgi:hypothetical protein
VSFVNARPFLETPHGGALGPNIRRVLYGGLKLATYAGVQGVFRASGGRGLLGPSIFVVARRGGS